MYSYLCFNPDFVSYFSSNKAYVKGQIWFQVKFFNLGWFSIAFVS